MQFKSTTIQPKGRNRYGNYLSTGNLTKKLVSYTNGGNTSTSARDKDNDKSLNTPLITPIKNIGVTISKPQGQYEWKRVTTDEIKVIGLSDLVNIPTYVGNLDGTSISLPIGVSLKINNNGTSATTLSVTIADTIKIGNGTIQIPVNVYTGNVASPEGDVIDDWVNTEHIKTIYVDYNYSVIQKRKGAAIRGVYDFANMTPVQGRRWCNGEVVETIYPNDGDYIDVIIYNGIYYRCKRSYNSDLRDWESQNIQSIINRYWEQTDASYDFIATNLLLADNAKINFATNNELYLTDTNGNVTAGAAGGNRVSFWAGSDAPEDGKWTVSYDGEMIAKKGTFGNLTIGQDDYGSTSLNGEYQTDYPDVKNTIEIQPQILRMSAFNPQTAHNQNPYSTITIAPYFDRDKYDLNAPFEVLSYSNDGDINTMWTDGKITCGNINMLFGENITREYKNPTDDNPFTTKDTAVFTPFSGMRIVPLTDDTSKFTKYSNIWFFNGQSLGVSSTIYPYVIKERQEGYWILSKKADDDIYSVSTGIASSTTPKQPNWLYVKI
jgi:hypothetical protein